MLDDLKTVLKKQLTFYSVGLLPEESVLKSTAS